jgi:hypothetical protein
MVPSSQRSHFEGTRNASELPFNSSDGAATGRPATARRLVLDWAEAGPGDRDRPDGRAHPRLLKRRTARSATNDTQPPRPNSSTTNTNLGEFH